MENAGKSRSATRKSPWDRPLFAQETLKSLVSRAERGDKAAAEQVSRILTERPEMKSSIRQMADLTTRVEDAWVRAVAFGDEIAARATRAEVEKMKVDMLGPNHGVLEKMLVSAVVVSYLAHQHAAALAAMPEQTPAIAAMRDRRQESALRRLVAAIKSWELIARKKARGLGRPRLDQKTGAPDPPRFKLFDPASA